LPAVELEPLAWSTALTGSAVLCEAVLPDVLIGAHAAVTSRPLLTRDPRRVATYIPGAALIAP
jgi:predicted nucleic acid-binding protein